MQDTSAKYKTRDEAMQHLTGSAACRAKQTKMINCMYDAGMMVSKNDLDSIDYDYHQAAMRKTMSY